MGQNSALSQVLSAFKRKSKKQTPADKHAAANDAAASPLSKRLLQTPADKHAAADDAAASPLSKRLFAFSPSRAATKFSAAARGAEDATSELIPAVALSPEVATATGDNIAVVVRVRPRSEREASLGGAICVQPTSSCQLRLGPPAEPHSFAFDHVLGEGSSQADVFEVTGRLVVESCLNGFNGCLLAYGQTGSGKTHTMLGSLDSGNPLDGEQRGLIQRVFEHLFATVQAQGDGELTTIKCSFLEIYNEQISDLLCPGASGLAVREDGKRVYVEGLSEEQVTRVDDVTSLLQRGTANRRVGETLMNGRSSRSHTVFTASVERRTRGSEGRMPATLRSRLHLVDLAGSERQKTSGAAGERLKEAASINKSLSTLGLVIMNLVKQQQQQRQSTTHIPYRDSKLTHLLHDSLGGNAKCVMVAAVSPAAVNVAETLGTLRFADSAKRIRQKAVVNEDAEGDAEALRCEVRRLKAELAAAREGKVGDATPLKALAPALGTADACPPTTAAAGAGEGTRRALMGALRREEAAAKQAAALGAELLETRGLVAAKDADLRRQHMMLKLKESRLARLAPGGRDEGADERVAALQREVDLLHGRVDNHPEVKRFAVENLHLSQEVARLEAALSCGELAALQGDVAALRREMLGLAAALEEAQEGAAVAQADADAARAAWVRGEAQLREAREELRLREEAPELQQRAAALAAENDDMRLQLAQAGGLRQEVEQLTAHAAGLESETERLRGAVASLTQEALDTDAAYRGTLEELGASWDEISLLEGTLKHERAALRSAKAEAAEQQAQHAAAAVAAAGRIASALKAASAVQRVLQAKTAQVKELEAALEGTSEERDGLIEEVLALEEKVAAAEQQGQALKAAGAEQAQRAEAAERATATLQQALGAARERERSLAGEIEAAAAAAAAKEKELQGTAAELALAVRELAACRGQVQGMEAAAKEASAALAAARAESDAAAAEARTLRATLGTAQRRCAELEASRIAAEDAKDELAYELSDKSASLSEAKELIASQQAALAASKQDAERSAKKLFELSGKVDAARKAGSVSERERAALQGRVVQLEADLEDARAQVDAARGGPLEKEQQLLLTRAELAAARAKLGVATERADQLQAALKRRDAQISALRLEMAAEVSDAAQQVQQLLAAQERAEDAESRVAALERRLVEGSDAAHTQ